MGVESDAEQKEGRKTEEDKHKERETGGTRNIGKEIQEREGGAEGRKWKGRT